MKTKIIELGKKYDVNLYVNPIREAFDIIDYEVYVETFRDEFIGVYRHFTGKTSIGVEYPTECFLSELENDLNNYKTSASHI